LIDDAPWHDACFGVPALGRSRPHTTSRRNSMNLTRVVFLALAVLLPTSWTIAHAEDAPAADAPAKKEKKGKKAKKGDDKKADDKKAE